MKRVVGVVLAALVFGGCGGSGGGGGGDPAAATYAISGTITFTGAPMAGVTVGLSGATNATTTTAADGSYSFGGLANASYTVTPTMPGYVFTPAAVTVVATGTAAFDHDQTGNAILGTVTTASILWGVNDASPFFAVPNPPDGAGTVRARSPVEINPALLTQFNDMWAARPDIQVNIYSDNLGMQSMLLHLGTFPDFSVSSESFNVQGSLTANSPGQDFTAAVATWSILGVVTLSGNGMAGVTVSLSGAGSATTTTDAGGFYSFTGLVDGSYVVTPTLAGYDFSPFYRTVSTTGLATFSHAQSGNSLLEPVAVTSITWSAQDVSALFEAPDPPDGVGSIRARNSSELAPGDVALFNALWASGGTVTFLFSHALGTDTIDLHVGAFPQFATTSNQFIVVGSLTAPATGQNFTATVR